MIDAIIKLAKNSDMINIDIFEKNNKIFMFAEDTIDSEKLYELNGMLENMGFYFEQTNIKMATLKEIEKL
ncbi:MAG: hypothetical protein U9N42_06760 [Campylobacterota bacterium]|nr:hypothetical protein [Campylobacterota bacterium]